MQCDINFKLITLHDRIVPLVKLSKILAKLRMILSSNNNNYCEIIILISSIYGYLMVLSKISNYVCNFVILCFTFNELKAAISALFKIYTLQLNYI